MPPISDLMLLIGSGGEGDSHVAPTPNVDGHGHLHRKGGDRVGRINPTGWTAHQRAVDTLRASYAAIPPGSTVRLAKKTSNLFRPRAEAGPAGLDVSGLDGVIEI